MAAFIKWLIALFSARKDTAAPAAPDISALPDDQPIPDDEADVIVGSVDDSPAVPLEPGNPAEVPVVPEDAGDWDATAHSDEYADDPAVVVTDDPEDGSVYSSKTS